MKICLVTDEFQGITGGGGIGACFAGLSRILAQQGQEVDVLITSNKKVKNLCNKIIDQLLTEGIKLLFLSDIHKNDIIYAAHRDNIVISYEVFQFILNSKYDVVHFHEYLGLGFYTTMARREGLLDHTFVITQTHGSTSWVRRHNLALPDLHTLEVEAMERKQIELSDLVISPSQYMLDWYLEENISLPDTRVINWVLPAWVNQHNSETELVTRPIESNQLRNLIFFGRHEKRKGIELFVEALRGIPDNIEFDVTFLGRFDMIDRENSVSYVLRKVPKFSGQISFYADYDQASAHKYMQKQKDAVCIMPSLIENSPCAVGEVLTQGLPFIATNVGGTRYLIDEASRPVALIDPTSESLIKRIIEIYKNGIPPIKASLVPEYIFKQWDELHKDISIKINPIARETGEPLVSVVLTHYERPVLVRRALNHLKNQTYNNIEIILVDDGSPSILTQKELNKIEIEFGGLQIKVVRSSNKYLGAARNLGATHARGEYLLFHDDDNISEPNEIELFVKAALTSKFDILTAQSYIFHDQDKPELGRIEYFPIGIGGDFSFFRNRFGDANALISRKAFDRVGGFSEHYGVGWEDWEFFLKAYSLGLRMGIVPIPLFRYYASGTGMLASGMPRLNNNRIFDAIRQSKLTLSADLMQYMRREEVNQQILDKTWWNLSREYNSGIHHQLTSLEPNSDEAIILLVDLAFALGRAGDAIALGMTRAASRKEIGRLVAVAEYNANKRNLFQFRADHCRVNLNTNLTAYSAIGWATSEDMMPFYFEGMIIGGRYYSVVNRNNVYRGDVYNAHNGIGSPDVGFEIILVEKHGDLSKLNSESYKEVIIKEICSNEVISLLVEKESSDVCFGWIESLRDLSVSAIELPVISNDSQDSKLEIIAAKDSGFKLIVTQMEGYMLRKSEDGRYDIDLDTILDIEKERLIYLVSENAGLVSEATVFSRN